MHFDFDDDQYAFRDAVRALLDERCGPDAVRGAWTSNEGHVPGLWSKLTEMGVIGMLAPESAGGLGLSAVDLVLILEEAGAHALPDPLVETAAVAVPLLADAGDDRVREVVDGATVAAVSPLDDFAINADVADYVLLFRDGLAHLVARPDVSVVPHRSVDGARRLSTVTADLSDTTAVGNAGLAARAFDAGALGLAAEQCGLAQRMLAITVDYVRERRQFGVPVGSFQAVKHHLANSRVALEFARTLVHRAAYSLDHDEPATAAHVSMAKSKADEAALLTARAALQCHGAIGYTTEHDLHLFMKRSWALARSWGSPAWHRRRVAASLARLAQEEFA
ncbi:MAG: acyl-CoA dehydrogenase [Actinomycetia bacterium]|nr:acyl-CoA dehydrogenase [Actinomycetes bacterium]